MKASFPTFCAIIAGACIAHPQFVVNRHEDVSKLLLSIGLVLFISAVGACAARQRWLS